MIVLSIVHVILFCIKELQNGCVCLDFKDLFIIQTDNTIRTPNWWSQNSLNPRSWAVECKNESSSWVPVSEEKDCPDLRY